MTYEPYSEEIYTMIESLYRVPWARLLAHPKYLGYFVALQAKGFVTSIKKCPSGFLVVEGGQIAKAKGSTTT